MSDKKRTASERENDTVANVAEVVWGLLTGTVGVKNSEAIDAFAGNSPMDKVRHYEMLRRTDKAAAKRFAAHVGFLDIVVLVKGWGDGEETRNPVYKRVFYATPGLWHDLIYIKSADALEFLKHIRLSLPWSLRGQIVSIKHVNAKGWQHGLITKL